MGLKDRVSPMSAGSDDDGTGKMVTLTLYFDPATLTPAAPAYPAAGGDFVNDGPGGFAVIGHVDLGCRWTKIRYGHGASGKTRTIRIDQLPNYNPETGDFALTVTDLRPTYRDLFDFLGSPGIAWLADDQG